MDDTAPDWLWEFDGRDWGWHSKDPRDAFKNARLLNGHYAAKMKWVEACRAWLEERGLLTAEHYNVTYQEYKRIEREEPHRILRRPLRDPAS